MDFIAGFCGALCGVVLMGLVFFNLARHYIEKFGRVIEQQSMPRMIFDSMGPLFPIQERDFYIEPDNEVLPVMDTESENS
jgi:hypothetical protein